MTVCGDVYRICSQNDTVQMMKCQDSPDELYYYVYKLKDPHYCDMAYCAGTLPGKCDCDTCKFAQLWDFNVVYVYSSF